jgi:hypothetical protein
VSDARQSLVGSYWRMSGRTAMSTRMSGTALARRKWARSPARLPGSREAQPVPGHDAERVVRYGPVEQASSRPTVMLRN